MREAVEILFQSYLTSAPERELSCSLHVPTLLLQKKTPRYLLESRLVGPRSQFRCSGEEKNSYACGKSKDISSIIKAEPAHSSDSTIPEHSLKKL
jgi:hypothetical protein